MVDRFVQLLLTVSTILLSWLWMMAVHEFGHVILAWTCGETVSKVVLHPLAISRSDITHINHPLLVIWGGPVLGSFLPTAGMLVANVARFRFAFLCRFF